tara:strand:+ start:383 stop:595 length:213 start_codon:yes stop_codon:yes gene_type:complete
MKKQDNNKFYSAGRFGKMIKAIHLSELSIKKSSAAIAISIIALLLSLMSAIGVIAIKSELAETSTQREGK